MGARVGAKDVPMPRRLNKGYENKKNATCQRVCRIFVNRFLVWLLDID